MPKDQGHDRALVEVAARFHRSIEMVAMRRTFFVVVALLAFEIYYNRDASFCCHFVVEVRQKFRSNQLRCCHFIKDGFLWPAALPASAILFSIGLTSCFTLAARTRPSCNE
jgi:hypothetical protein